MVGGGVESKFSVQLRLKLNNITELRSGDFSGLVKYWGTHPRVRSWC